MLDNTKSVRIECNSPLLDKEIDYLRNLQEYGILQFWRASRMVCGVKYPVPADLLRWEV